MPPSNPSLLGNLVQDNDSLWQWCSGGLSQKSADKTESDGWMGFRGPGNIWPLANMCRCTCTYFHLYNMWSFLNLTFWFFVDMYLDANTVWARACFVRKLHCLCLKTLRWTALTRLAWTEICCAKYSARYPYVWTRLQAEVGCSYVIHRILGLC